MNMKKSPNLERVVLKLVFWMIVLLFCISACTYQAVEGQLGFLKWGFLSIIVSLFVINVVFEIAVVGGEPRIE